MSPSIHHSDRIASQHGLNQHAALGPAMAQPLHIFQYPASISLLLVGELGCANVAAAQLDVEDPLHGTQHLLVGGSSAPLEIGDDGLCGVALGGQVLLCHLGLDVLSRGGDDAADILADGVGLDDVVGAVNLGQALALDLGAL